ncbi:MAG: hypothetical protein QOJ32_2753 [Frankiaceae bacterium]|nr:hypothetical protein [Frankiaceae bacterium]
MRIVALLIALLSVAGTGLAACAPLPASHPSNLAHVGNARQMLVAVGNSRTSSYATLYAYEKNADGSWRDVFGAMPARVGYNGWHWAAQRVQNDGSSPAGTFSMTTAFGLSANPGTRLAYRHSDGDDYWSGDPRDPRTYNLYQTSVSPRRTWRLTDATTERVASYPTQYAYAAVINAYRPPDASITYNAARGQYETSQPTATGHGFSIFLHINGRGSTAGCVSVDQANMLRILRWVDPAKAPRITMAPSEWLATA